jgi:hypothetical protein
MTRDMTPSTIHPKISITISVQIIFPLNKVLGKRGEVAKLLTDVIGQKYIKRTKKIVKR